MTVQVHVQYALPERDLPSSVDIKRWAVEALEGRRTAAQMTVRIVNDNEAALLNQTYRHRQGPTNVLSFPFVLPVQKPTASDVEDYLGDVVICASVVAREAHEQHKELIAHWAHMVVHGSLHLLGYDHLADEQAQTMEALETTILARMGYPDPYHTTKTL